MRGMELTDREWGEFAAFLRACSDSLTMGDMNVLASMMGMMDEETGLIDISQKVTALDLNVTPSSVSRAIKHLVAAKFLIPAKSRYYPDSRTAYTVNWFPPGTKARRYWRRDRKAPNVVHVDFGVHVRKPVR